MIEYEVMLIVDPKEDYKNVENLINEIFDKPKIKKLERTELSYEINKSKIAQYVQINVKTSPKEIKELTRKTNILKTFWRILVINLEKEIGREESIKLISKRKEYLTKKYNEYMLQKKTKINNFIEKSSNEKKTLENTRNKNNE